MRGWFCDCRGKVHGDAATTIPCNNMVYRLFVVRWVEDTMQTLGPSVRETVEDVGAFIALFRSHPSFPTCASVTSSNIGLELDILIDCNGIEEVDGIVSVHQEPTY